jgi:carboxyl-terminal processing protease
MQSMNQISRLLRTLGFFSLGGLIATSSVLLTPHSGSSVPTLGLKDSPKALVDEVWQIVNNTYVDGTFNHNDWQITRQQLLSVNYSSKAQAYDAIRSALKKLDDPYTRFLDPQSFANETQRNSGELSGIGVTTTLDKSAKTLIVVKILKDSPKAGLQSGDLILEIDGKSIKGLEADKAARLIRGEPNTIVKLKIARGVKKILDVAVTRQVIQVPIVFSMVKQRGNNKIGYIYLLEFDDHADTQVKAAIESLEKQKVKGFILDLRGNPGGLVSMAIGISRL